MGPSGPFTTLAPAASTAGSPAIDLEVSKLGTASKLSVTGEIDVATAPRLGEALEWLRVMRCRRVVLDLRGVSFCDCAGLSVFIDADLAMTRAGGHLVICGASPGLRRLLGITHLDTALDVD